MPAAEDKVSFDTAGVQTREEVLTSAISKLKHALEDEQHESDVAHKRISDLEDMLRVRDDVIQKRTFELKVEHTRAELSLVTSTRGGGRNPFIIPKIIKNILPEEIGNSSYLWCCIKVQGSWVVIHDDVDSNMSAFANKSSKEIDFIAGNAVLGKIASLPSFDNVMREMEPSHHVVLSRILPPYEISVLWSQGLGAGFTTDSSHHGRKDVVALSVSPTCAWLLWIDPVLLSNFDPLSSLTQFFSCVETASHLAIVVLSQYYEHQHQSAQIVGGMTARDVSLALLPDAGTAGGGAAASAWRSLPREMSKHIDDCTCEVYIILDKHKRSHQFSIALASDMSMCGVDYDDVGAIPSLVLSAVKTGTTIQCNDADNPQRSRGLDLSGDVFTKAIIAAPLSREQAAGHKHQPPLYQCAVAFRFKHRTTNAFDLLAVNAIVANVSPIIHKFLESTEMQVVCPVSMLHSRQLRDQPLDSDGYDSDLDEHDEHRSRADRHSAMKTFALVQEQGLAGLLGSSEEMRAVAESLDSLWAAAFLFEAVPADGLPAECQFVSNDGESRSLEVSALNKRLQRLLAKSYKKALSREQHVEKVNGVSFKSFGVLELLSVNEEYADFASAMPDHASSLQCVSLLGLHSDDSVSLLVFIAGRHWRPLSLVDVVPRARHLQAIVESALECRELRGLYEVERQLEQTLDMTLGKVSHGKQVSATLREFQASLDDLSRREARGEVQGSVRRALLLLLDSFAQQFYFVKFPSSGADSISVSNCFIAEELTLHEAPSRRWLYDRCSDEWITQAEVSPAAHNCTMGVFDDWYSFADIEGAGIESHFKVTWGAAFFNDGEQLSSDSVVFDDATVDVLHTQLQSFFDKHHTTLFGTAREADALSHFCDGHSAETEEGKLDSVFLDLGCTNARSMLEQGRAPCSYASDESFIGALSMLEPQFILLPVRLQGSSDTSGDKSKEIHAIVVRAQCGDVLPHPCFPAVPPRITEQLLARSRLHTEGRAATDSSLVRLDNTGSLYNFVLDSGLFNCRIHRNCLSFVYSRGFKQHNSADCVQYLVLSFWDVLIAPSHIKDLRRHLDYALLPLNVNAAFKPLFQAAAAAEAIARKSIETLVKVTNEEETGRGEKRRVEISALNVDGDVGFIEESLRAVEAALPAGSSSALSVLSSCDQSLSELLAQGAALLGDACVCSASFLISEDDLNDLLGEQSSRDDSFSIARELVIMQSKQQMLPSSSRIVTANGSGDEGACSGASLEVFDGRDIGKVIKGGLPMLPSAFLQGQSRVVMLSIKVSDRAFGAGPADCASSSSGSSDSGAGGGAFVTIGAALFWITDSTNQAEKISLFSKDSSYTLHFSISNTLLLLARIAACTAGGLLAVTSSELRGSSRLRAVLVDEVAHSIAYKTAVDCAGAVLNGQRGSSPGSASDGLRRLGYIDSLSGGVLDALEERLNREGRVQRQVDAASAQKVALEGVIERLREREDELLQFISAMHEVCFAGDESFNGGIDKAKYQTLLFTVSINQQILRHAVDIICNNNLYEELTFQLRLLACSLLRHDCGRSSEEWDALTWTQRVQMLADRCLSERVELARDGGLLLDQHVVVAWCLPEQRCDEASVRGVLSWDMLREAMRTRQAVLVEAAHDNVKHSTYKYVPVVSDGVCAVVLQYTFDPLRVSKFDSVVQSSLDYFFSQMSLGMLRRSSAMAGLSLERSKHCSLVDAIESMVLHEQVSCGDETFSWLNDDAFEADISSLIARLLRADGCFLVPVKGHEHAQFEGLLCRWEDGVARRDSTSFVSLEKESIGHLLCGSLDTPQHTLRPSTLGHSTAPRHVLSLPVQLDMEGRARGLLLAESLLRPSMETEARLLAVSTILALLLSRHHSRSANGKASSAISELHRNVADARKVIAEKTFSSTILHCHSLCDLETALEASLQEQLGLTGSLLLRVRHEDVLAHGESMRASMAGIELSVAGGVQEQALAASGRPEQLAAQSLVSSTVIYHKQRSDKEWSATAYVPVAFAGASTSDESSASWVLQCRFDSSQSLEDFRFAGGEGVALSAAKDVRQWLKTFRHKRDTELRERSLQFTRDVNQQVARALQEVRAAQADGAIGDWDALAAALVHAFGGKSGALVQGARLYWVSPATEDKGFTASWDTCDPVSSGAFAEDVPNSMLTLKAFLRVGSWSVVRARAAERVFQKIVSESCLCGRFEEVMAAPGQQSLQSPVKGSSPSKQLLQLERTDADGFDSVWLSVGADSDRPAVLELRFAPETAVSLDWSGLADTFCLLREAVCHSVWGLLRTRDEVLSASASECESRLGLAQLRSLSRCLGELCAESTFTRSVDDLCLSVQSVVAELPGVHSIWLQCVDTSSGGVMYENVCLSPALEAVPWQQTPVRRQGALDDSDVNSLSYGMTISTLHTSPATFKGARRDADGTARAIEPPSRPGVEFVLECVEVAGRLVVHHMTGEELRLCAGRALAGLQQGDDWDPIEQERGLRDEVAEGGEDADAAARFAAGTTSKEYRRRERSVLQTLARALARRVYELHKGKQNLQVLADKKSEAAQHQRRVKEVSERLELLESAKASLFVQYSQTLEECDNMRRRLSEERDVAAATKTQHLQAVASYNDNVAELRRELARKDALLSQSIAAVQQERKLGEDKKAAVSKELERALESEAEAEEARKKVCADLQAAENEARRKLKAYEGTIEALRAELVMLKEIVENSDVKFHVLMTKLSSTDEELARSRAAVITLRNDLATSALALAVSGSATEQVITEVVVTEEVVTHETVVNAGAAELPVRSLAETTDDSGQVKKATKLKKLTKK